METYKLWDNVPGLNGEEPVLEYFQTDIKATDATVVIFPGGGYGGRAPHEGRGYAKYLNAIGLDVFVCEYRVSPYRFPIELLDARRAVRYVRAHAAEFGVNPDRVAVMGSSAGGHLAALVSTYTAPIGGEGADAVDALSPIPNATILCYPVIHAPDEMQVAHVGSYYNLLGENRDDYADYSPDLLVNETTPPAFLWHTSDDDCVDVINSYLYAAALRRQGIRHELHVFPHGPHGLGLAPSTPNVAEWAPLMRNWFAELGWLK